MILKIGDQNRVRTLTLNRPDALNAFDDALYMATGAAFRAAAVDPEVSVVVMTGDGKAFSAGADLAEMQTYLADPSRFEGEYGAGFRSLIAELTAFPKPLICAVNGLGVGIGTTILGYADLVFMSTAAKLKCPFTSLGVAPEASSSYLLPQLVGRQNAAWLLMSSEWVGAAEAKEMGLVWKVCEPADLLPEAHKHAEVLASRSLQSLMAVKRTMTAPLADGIAAAREREDACYTELMGSAANVQALTDIKRGR